MSLISRIHVLVILALSFPTLCHAEIPTGLRILYNKQADIFVSTTGSDLNSGTKQEPVKTLSKAVSMAQSGQVISLAEGSHDLSGRTIQIDRPITISGENKNTTILKNGTMLNVTKGLTIENVKFMDFSNKAINLDVIDSAGINGVKVSNSIFDGIGKGIGQDVNTTSNDIFTDIIVENSEFKNMFDDPNTMVYGVFIEKGIISDVTIRGNIFSDIGDQSLEKRVYGIKAGTNSNRFITKNIWILNNTFTNIINKCIDRDQNGSFPENHAFHGFGSYIHVRNNKVDYISPCDADHEALYIKANYSDFIDNTVINGGAGHMEGDIIIKSSADNSNPYGKYMNLGNTVKNNKVTTTKDYIDHVDNTHPGQGITVYGEADVTGNTVITYSRKGGYFFRALGGKITVTNNTLEAISSDVGGFNIKQASSESVIKNNTLLIEDSSDTAINVIESGGAIIQDNTTCVNTGCTNNL